MKKRLGIYVHIPFCQRKCRYCDFLSSNMEKKVIDKYIEALNIEIRTYSRELKEYKVATIYIGGGTPSFVDSKYIKEILENIRNNYDVEEKAEITIEVNPGTLLNEKIQDNKESGINRVSIGLQSTNNEELELLGRIHTYEEFEKNYNRLRKVGFDNINIDIMSAIPNQTLESYITTLNKVVSLQPEHISSYSLIIEEGTYFYNHQKELKLVTEDEEREMYYKTKEILQKHGYERYEISNYAKKGYESKHNSSYWTGVDYIGFGIGASSYVKGTRYDRIRNIDEYISYYEDIENVENIKEKNKIECNIQVLTEKEKIEEYMFLGLRMIKGISKTDFAKQFNRTVEEIYGNVLDKYVKLGMLENSQDRIRLTEKGLDVSNAIFADFLLD